jgi:hypothetical protein
MWIDIDFSPINLLDSLGVDHYFVNCYAYAKTVNYVAWWRLWSTAEAKKKCQCSQDAKVFSDMLTHCYLLQIDIKIKSPCSVSRGINSK